MNWLNEEYKKNLETYEKKDGIKAIILYVMVMALGFFQGWLYTTDVSAAALNGMQIWIPLVFLVLFLCILVFHKVDLDTLGINNNQLLKSMGLGVVGAAILLLLQSLLLIMQGDKLAFSLPIMATWMIFAIGALEEEFIFRGYIQTRLAGLVKKQWLVGVINAVLFLSIHYPVKWVISGAFSIFSLSWVYVISLLALHFLCDAVYKKTNCIWGAIVLHFLYNAVGAML